MSANSINLVAVIASARPPVWVIDTLEKINEHDSLNLLGIIVQDTDVAADERPSTGGSYDMLRAIGSGIVRKLVDKPRFKLHCTRSRELPAPLRALQNVTVDASGVSGLVPDADLLLHFGDVSWQPDALPVYPLGCWSARAESLELLVEQAVVRRPPLFWLHLWCGESAATGRWSRLASHALPTQTYSITDFRNFSYSSLPDLFVSRLNWLAQGHNPQAFEAAQISSEYQREYNLPESYLPAQRGAALPFLLDALTLLAIQSRQRLRDRLQREQWQLAFRYVDESHDETRPDDIENYQVLQPAPDRLWADPHVIHRNGSTHVFFEDMSFEENKGTIFTAELGRDGFINEPSQVLDADHHLSFPSLMEHDNQVYMIPETASRKTISLYRASDFPMHWERVGNLMDNIDAADSTLYRHDGLWWLFTNGRSHPSVDERDQLWLFYSTDFLNGDWQPHPLNPVVTGVDRARMAGPLFEKHGVLHRPSQHSAYRYGFGLNVSRIDTLSTTEYSETVISRTTPSTRSSWIGSHSMVRDRNVVVIDRLRRIRRRLPLSQRVTGRGLPTHQ